MSERPASDQCQFPGMRTDYRSRFEGYSGHGLDHVESSRVLENDQCRVGMFKGNASDSFEPVTMFSSYRCLILGFERSATH